MSDHDRYALRTPDGTWVVTATDRPNVWRVTMLGLPMSPAGAAPGDTAYDCTVEQVKEIMGEAFENLR